MKPNLILIMTDQQRWDTIRAWGCGHMITPHLDRLAERAMSFRTAFSSGATCVVSRSSLFTGMYPHNTGAYSFDDWSHHRTWVHDLAENGYHCVNIGKMHIQPIHDRMAFHERIVVENPTGRYTMNGGVDDEWGRYLSMHGEERPNDRHLSDPGWHDKYQAVPWEKEEHLHPDVFIGNSALAWIRRHRPKKPVFLQIGFTGPHEPYSPLPRHLELYRDITPPAPVYREGELANKPPQHKAHQQLHTMIPHESCIDMAAAQEDDLVQMRRHYCAMITTIDEKIGEILNELERQGYLDNAVVAFTSDHGDMLGDHKLAYKWLMYDGSVRVPLLLWDTRRQGGGATDDLVSLLDIGPTFLEAAGIPIPSHLEGKSLLGYTNGEAPENRRYVYCQDNYMTMMRGQDYKLVYYAGQPHDGELYDLNQDPGELYNLYYDPAYAQKRDSMLLELLDWVQQSHYKTAGYKNKMNRSPKHWPKQTYYLHS